MKKVLLWIILGLLFFTSQNFEVSAKNDNNQSRSIIYNVDDDLEKVKIVVEFSPNMSEIETFNVADKEIYNYEDYTLNALEQIDCDCESYASKIAPFIEFIIYKPEKKSDYTPFLKKIARLDDVTTIYIESINDSNFQDLVLDDGGGGGGTGYNALYSSIYENTTSYDGTGIKIGMMENTVPDDDLYDLDTASITYYSSYGSQDMGSHASAVAAIMVGDNGIAQGASLYSYKMTSATLADYDTALTWMITSGVHVVNISYGLVPSYGVYGSIDKLVDYYIYEYDISIVASAGNGDNNLNYGVSSPAMAFNAITVGMLEEDGEHVLSDVSSYDELTQYSEKPTLVAQGEYTIYEYGEGYKTVSGTSFAAPAVTATIACMMDRRSILKSKPALVTAIITAQSYRYDLEDNYDFDQNGLSDEAGSGALDVNKSINSVWLSGYNYTDENDNYPSVVSSKTIYLSMNDHILVSLWWGKRVIVTGYNSFSVRDTLDINLELRDQYDNLICVSNSSNYNFEILDCNITTSGVYYINVILNEAHTTTNNDDVQYFGYAYNID